jgi:signal transduction histidine kinase
VQGIGIRNMKKRVKEVDGLLEILSSPGNGAEFKFTLPIER